MKDLKSSADAIITAIDNDTLDDTVKTLSSKNEFCIIVQDSFGKVLASNESLEILTIAPTCGIITQLHNS